MDNSLGLCSRRGWSGVVGVEGVNGIAAGVAVGRPSGPWGIVDKDDVWVVGTAGMVRLFMVDAEGVGNRLGWTSGGIEGGRSRSSV